MSTNLAVGLGVGVIELVGAFGFFLLIGIQASLYVALRFYRRENFLQLFKENARDQSLTYLLL